MSRYFLIAAFLFLCAAPASTQLQLARIDGTVLGPTDETLEITRTATRAVRDARKHPERPATDERAA